MTHVLHMTTWHPYIHGAAGAFVLEQCAALDAVGMEVGLIFSRIEGLRALKLRNWWRGIPGLIQLSEPVPTLGFKSWNLPGMNGMVPYVNKAMLKNRFSAYASSFGRPDILHAHVALEAGSAAYDIAEAFGLEYVVTEHSTEILNGNIGCERTLLARRIYERAKSVIAVSTTLADRILEICPNAKVRVIGNVVRDFVFQLSQDTANARDRIVLAAIGNLVPHKRTHNAIEALAGLPKQIKANVELIIIGDGPERGRLEELAGEAGIRAIFYGNLPHDQAMRLLAKADLLVHASAYETFGVVLAEAMALGLPVVATRSGGPQEFVTEETGYLVAVDNVDELRAALSRVFTDISLWRGNRESISRFAYNRFHEISIGAAIAESYK